MKSRPLMHQSPPEELSRRLVCRKIECFINRLARAYGHLLKIKVAGLLAVLSLGSVHPSDVIAQGYSNVSDSLRSLPPINAMPINPNANSQGIAPDALTSPAYCDFETLRESATIRAIRFWGSDRGIAVGDHGSILVTQDGGQSWSGSSSGVQCRLNDVTWVDARRVVVVGGGLDVVTRMSRGVVLVSRDSGQTWHKTGDSELPYLNKIESTTGKPDSVEGDRRQAIFAFGHSDPITGATKFQSRDGGRSWQSVQGQWSSRHGAMAKHSAGWSEIVKTRSIIRTSIRLEGQTVLCAGDHGNLFRSTDDGRTWVAVHGENASCAALVIACNEDQIPWTLIGRESLEKRLRINVLVGGARDRVADSLEQATMQLGVAALDTFPQSDPSESIAELKLWIDVHHPPIVAMDANLDDETKSALLQYAVANGADKVVEYERDGRGESLLHDSAMLPGCGVLAGDFADDSLMLASDFELSPNTATKNPWVAINTRYSGGSQGTRGDSLGLGVRLTSGHRLPARQSKASRRRLQVIQGRLKQQTAIANLFRSESGTAGRGGAGDFADALGRLLDQTSREDQFRSSWSIARQAIGKPNQATVWNEISVRFEDSSAARLLGLHARARQQSLEWKRHRVLMSSLGYSDDRREFGDTTAAPIGALLESSQELLPSGGGHAAIVSPFQSTTAAYSDTQLGVVQATASLPLTSSQTLGNGYGKGLLSPFRQSKSREIDLAWQMHPIRLIVEDALDRSNRLEADSAKEDSTGDSDLSADVRRIAERNSKWSSLLQPLSPQAAIAVRINSPPRLDGTLNESFWNETIARPAETRDGQPLKLQFAWDDQFIYVAIGTPGRSMESAEVSEGIGQRDADLTQSDRVELGFDIDRDLLTAMNIAFTSDGRTHDDLDGFDRWNPTWYVASHASSDGVTVEIAIEQTGLGVAVQAGDKWFVESRAVASGRPRRCTMMPDPLSRVRVDFR